LVSPVNKEELVKGGSWFQSAGPIAEYPVLTIEALAPWRMKIDSRGLGRPSP